MIALLIASALAVAAVSTGILYQQIGLRRDRRSHPPLGRLISVSTAAGSQQPLHLYEAGTGTPAVVFESGIAGSLLSWSLVQDRVASSTRALSYDRAGLGWSARPRQARTLDNMLHELQALLNAVPVNRPLVLVGHSFGGLLVRAYAHRWPAEVAGLVLVDPVGHASWARASKAEQARLRRGVLLSRRGATLARFGVVRGALDLLVSGRRWLPKLVSRTSAGRGTAVLERLIGEVRQLPAWSHAKIRAHWSDARCFDAMADYLESMPACAANAMDLVVPSNIPVTVLSAATATAQELTERDSWVSASAKGRHLRVHDSSHWIQIQKPGVVIGAIQDMLRLAHATATPSAANDPQE